MRRLLPLLVLLWSLPCEGAWARVTSTGAAATVLNTSPMTVTLGAAVTTNNRIICEVVLTSSGTPSTTSVTDGGNTYHKDLSLTFTDGATNALQETWSANVAAPSTPTVSVAWVGNGGAGIACAAYSGLSTALNPVDVSSAATGNSTTPNSGTTMATTATNQLAVGLYGDTGYSQAFTGSGSAVPGASAADTNADIALEDGNVPASGSMEFADGTIPVANVWAMSIVIYHLAGAGGATTTSGLTLLGVGLP